MFADAKWSRCNTREHYGVYIWTAGQWINPKYKSTFVWKMTDQSPRPMRYTNWRKASDEPNNAYGHDACVNLFKKYRYTWNDEPCSNKYCFICEN